jgi:hypothetical protein
MSKIPSRQILAGTGNLPLYVPMDGDGNASIPGNISTSNGFGSPGQFLGVGSGNIEWQTVPGGASAIGPTGAVQFTNGSGSFEGNTGLVYDGVSKLTNPNGSLDFNASILGGNGIVLRTIGASIATAGDDVYLDGGNVGVLIGANGGSSYLAVNQIQPLVGFPGVSGQFLGVAGSGNIEWQTISGSVGPTGPQGPPGPTGPVNLQGLQYNLNGTTVSGTITNLPNTTVWSTLTWTLASTISFTVPPNWSAGNFVSWDGVALYDFNINSTNYWSVYYTTTSQPTEQPLLGVKNINNAIVNFSPQMYFPMNLLIPPTYLQPGETINLRVYGFTNGTIVQFSQTPVINARVSVTLD